MNRGVRLLVVLLLGAAACTTTGSGSATTPITVPPDSTTGTVAPPTSTTSTTPTGGVTSTAVADRVAEIEAILQDLEQRRLTALYEGDREAFAALFVNEGYLERSLGAFDVVEFEGPPRVDVEVISVLRDDDECLAVRAIRPPIVGMPETTESEFTAVMEPIADRWGFSYLGEGWLCEGPHPLQP